MVQFQVLVKALSGRTIVVSGCSVDLMVGALVERVALLTGVLGRASVWWVSGSKVLPSESTLGELGLGRDSLLLMSCRLERGASRQNAPQVPGLLDLPQLQKGWWCRRATCASGASCLVSFTTSSGCSVTAAS